MFPLEVDVGIQESPRKLLVNNHILKIAAILKPSRKYNRRAAIIEDLRAGRSATEIRFVGYPKSTVYDIVAKYTALEQSNEDSNMPARKNHSKECTARIPIIFKRAQVLISDDPG